MAIDFRTVPISFDPTSGQTQVETGTVIFGGRVRRAAAALNGFTVFYTNGDHPTFRQRVDLSIEPNGIQGNSVTVTARLLMRDNSGNIDDPFGGNVDVVVLADVQ